MADDTAQVDLAALHDAIISAIKAQFPCFAVVDDYPLDKKAKPVPACYIDLEDFEPANDEDPWSGQQALNLHFSARIVIGYREATAGRQVRLLAAALAAFIHEQRWGQPVNAADVMGGYADAFDAELDQFLVWRVEWRQVGHFGTSVWGAVGTEPEPAPTAILSSFEPTVGAGHQDDYDLIVEISAS